MLKHLITHKRLLVLLIALIVRVAMLAALPDVFDFVSTGAIHGSEAYDSYAQNLIDTGIYGRVAGEADATIPPLYSYALAGVYALFGRGYWQVGLWHTLLDLISIALLYDIGRRLFKRGQLWGVPVGEWVGAGAGLFYALYPYLVFQNLTLIDTAFFMVLLHAFVWLMVHLRERDKLDRTTLLIAIIAGVVLGLSVLTRALLPLLALFVAFWFLMRLNWRQTLLRLLPVALVGIAITLPWVIRSSALYGEFVAVALNSGENLFQGNNAKTVPVFRAGYDVQWIAPDIPGPGADDRLANNKYLMDLGLTYLRDNPQAIPELLWVKFWIHWSIDITPRRNPQPGEQLVVQADGSVQAIQTGTTITGVTDANIAYDGGLLDTLGRPIHRLYFGTLFMLALIGIALSWRQWRDVSLLWFVQISMTAMYLIFHPSTRYRVPSDPLLFLFSAYALVLLAIWLMNRRKAQGATNKTHLN